MRKDINPFEKLIPGEGIQRSPLRLARVTSVDAEKGTVSLTFLDSPGATEAFYSNSDAGVYSPPVPNTLCIVSMSAGRRSQILRYIPLGYPERVKNSQIRQVNPGEYFLESMTGGVDDTQTPLRTGTEFYMNNAGDVLIATAYGDVWQILRDDNKLFERFANYELQTEACRLYSGLVRRDIQGNTRIITQNGIPITMGGRPLTEVRLAVVEKADNSPDSSPGTDDPIVEIILGNKISDTGSTVRSESGNDIAAQIRTRGDKSVITVDHEGNAHIQAKTFHFVTDSGVGFDFKTEDNGDISISVKSGQTLRIDADKMELGNGSMQKLVNETFIPIFNSHTHVDAFGLPTAIPTTQASATSNATENLEAS